MQLPLSAFNDQFLLTRGKPPAEWHVCALDGWTLATHPDLPVHAIRNGRSERMGWLVGHAINETGELIDGNVTVPQDVSAGTSWAALERWLYRFGGRFIAVICGTGVGRVYLDPAGTLAAVYSTRERMIASTPALLDRFAEQAHPRDEALTQTLGRNRFFPAGLTPYEGVRRLLPNHYLDLDRWTAVRHWLHRSPERMPDEQINQAVNVVGNGIRRSLQAVTQHHVAYVGLTAGKDSRMILASGRDFRERLRCFTFDYGKEPRDFDVTMSRHIADRLGLEHAVLPVGKVSADVWQAYLERVGYAGGGGKARDFYQTCRRDLQSENAFLTGFTGEVGRQFYRFAEADGDRPPSAEEVLQTLGLPTSAPFVEAVSIWLEGIEYTDRRALTAQMYLELRVGCWASPHMYGAAPFALNLTPLCHRDVYEAMLRLPLWYWREHRLPADVVRSQWPELGRVPYRRVPGVGGLFQHIGRRIGKRLRTVIRRFTAPNRHAVHPEGDGAGGGVSGERK